MKLYLIQHGEAKSEAEDPERSLTTKGLEEVRKVSKVGKALNIRPSMVYHSGKIRAQQTAEMIAGGLNISNLPVNRSRDLIQLMMFDHGQNGFLRKPKTS